MPSLITLGKTKAHNYEVWVDGDTYTVVRFTNKCAHSDSLIRSLCEAQTLAQLPIRENQNVSV